MTDRTLAPWTIFIIGNDRAWVRPACYRAYREGTGEEQALFRLGLSDHGYACGAETQAGEPPPGTLCRCCWKPA